MCAEHLIDVLGIEMICVYILDVNIPNQVCKYTVRSHNGEEINLTNSQSIISETINSKTSKKYMDMKNTKYNNTIDGIPGIIIKNLLSVPLKNEKNNTIIGGIHFLNKFEGKTSFTELDELYANIYSEMAVSSLLCIQKVQHINFRSDILTGILTSATELSSILPNKNSLIFKDIHPYEILKIMEDNVLHTLKCYKVKIFLVSDYIQGIEDGYLVSRDLRTANAPKARRSMPLPVTLTEIDSCYSGKAGYVARSLGWVVNSLGNIDIQINTEIDIDLDYKEYSSVTAPMLTSNGDCIAVIQMILGVNSPKLNGINSKADNITFEQSASWLIKSTAIPLQLIIHKIGRKDED